MNNIKIPILCYHRVHSDDDPMIPKVIQGQYCGHVTRSVFKNQMKLLAEHGYKTVTHLDLMKWIYEGVEFPQKKLVAIDFDDARLNVLENAFPIMREYGFTGTVFVISELASGNLPKMADFPAMTWEHLGKLKNAGWTIGSHTATHSSLAKLFNSNGGSEKVEIELRKSKHKIKKYLGVNPLNFAYPTGNRNEKVEAIVKKYYRTARLWQNDFKLAFNIQKTNPYRLVSMNISMLVTENDFKTILLNH